MAINSDELNDCGCCEGTSVETPVRIHNRPGLSAIAYRVGTHPQFKESMLARLSSQDHPKLQELRTRDDDDFSILLLDAWATVGDVLTFYQERIANESYLRTATERLSVMEMAKLIGYKPRSGVAASTYLAFKVEDPPGLTPETAALSPREVKVPKGTRVQSVPAPGEQAQIFETVEEIEARVEWNEMTLRLSYSPGLWENKLFLKGDSTWLKRGDALVLIYNDGMRSDSRVFCKVKDIRIVREFGGYVEVILDRRVRSIDGTRDLVEVYAFRTKAKLFGHNAPDWRAMSDEVKRGYFPFPDDLPNEWPRFNIRAQDGVSTPYSYIFLDRVYPEILSGFVSENSSWAALLDGINQRLEIYKITEVIEVNRADYTLSSNTTRLRLHGNFLMQYFNDRLRDTVIYVQSESLALGEHPVTRPLSGSAIYLDQKVAGLSKGQKLLVAGLQSSSESNDQPVSEVVFFDHESTFEGRSIIHLVTPLQHSYIQRTVKISANVAGATHGETIPAALTGGEVLGNGDATQAFQKFQLKEKPLTYVPDATGANAAGAQSTLEVRVNDLLWREVPSFYGRVPEERIYVTSTNDEGVTTVMFGDGKTGARLPTGQANVKAHYRKGIGLNGLVKAHRLSQLVARPPGIQSVKNPMDATGAGDPEKLSEARRNAPLTVMTLDRIVSLRDFEDFARSYPGIAKARAITGVLSGRKVIIVSIAGETGADVPTDSDLYKGLYQALHRACPPNVFLFLANHKTNYFRLEISIKVEADYAPAKVAEEVKQKLEDIYSFTNRELEQSVKSSEIIQEVHSVSGVSAIHISKLNYDPLPTRKAVEGILFPRLSQFSRDEVTEAGLLLIKPELFEIRIMQ